MHTIRKFTVIFSVTVIALLSAFAFTVIGQPEEASPVVAFDIANNMAQMWFDESPVHESGMPNGGNPFIIHGYIYPEGTLNETNGINPDGSPEFPELVLGEWICRGYFIKDGPATTSGAWAITTQTFSLGETAGESMFVTEGYEYAEPGVAIQRVITGGTGSYSGIEGVATQTMIGANATGAPNLRIQVQVAE